MTGKNRANRNIRLPNKPNVPSRNDQSQIVGVNTPQDEGRKSRSRLPTTIMNRSSHMPILITIETQNRRKGVVRTRLNHNNWLTPMLITSTSQYHSAYGPNALFESRSSSNSLPLYQPTKCSSTYE